MLSGNHGRKIIFHCCTNAQNGGPPKKNLIEGDLVIIVDESVHRHDWKMARILKTEGSGPHVRRVRLKRSDGKVVLKDRTKIVPLELENSNR